MTNEEMLAKIAARVNPPSPAESVPSPTSATASPADAAPSLPLPPGFVWGRGANGAWAAFPAALAPKAPTPVAEASAPVVEAPAPAPVIEVVEVPTTAARRRGRPPKAPAPVVDNPAPIVEAPAAEIAIDVIRGLLDRKPARGSLFNVNIPTRALHGTPQLRVVPMCISRYGEAFERRTDPRGRSYYWATNDPPAPPSPHESDVTALAAGAVTLTPLDYDLTHRAAIDVLAEGEWNLGPG